MLMRDQAAFGHHDADVRLGALSVICESHKTVHLPAARDLALVAAFARANFADRSPGLHTLPHKIDTFRVPTHPRAHPPTHLKLAVQRV